MKARVSKPAWGSSANSSHLTRGATVVRPNIKEKPAASSSIASDDVSSNASQQATEHGRPYEHVEGQGAH